MQWLKTIVIVVWVVIGVAGLGVVLFHWRRQLRAVLAVIFRQWLSFLLYPLYLPAAFLARGNRFFTFVKEGTAKIVVRGDKFEKILIQWQEYTFDYGKPGIEKWRVVKGEEPWHLFGGLRFYGLWPLLDIAIWTQRWFDLQRVEGEIERPQFHEKVVDYALLRPDVYWTIERGAETKPPERIPLDVEFLVTMRVVNPYKAIFVAPINWTENVMARLDALFRSYIASKSLDELIEVKGDPKGMWQEFRKEDLVKKTLRKEWGIEIEGIQIKDIVLPKEYQEAAAAQKTEEMKAEGVRRRIEIEWGAIKKFDDLGRLVRTLEAAEKSPLATSLAVHAIPGIQEVLRGVFGRVPESLTSEEIQELRRVLREHQERQERQKG